jgi:hypothetical protein
VELAQGIEDDRQGHARLRERVAVRDVNAAVEEVGDVDDCVTGQDGFSFNC